MTRFLDRLQPLGLLAMRLSLGAIMIAHGWAKLMNPGMARAVASGAGAPAWMAYLVIAAEFFGGILVVLGLLTRPAAAAILIDMTVAILKVHLKNGFIGQGNYQFPLACWALAFALIFFGAGPIAIDSVLGGRGGRRAGGLRAAG